MSNWQQRAACRGLDTDIFYPEGRGPSREAWIASAVKICAGCPVRSDCAREATSRPERHGIWGGLDETERGYDHRGQVGKRRKVNA